MEFGFSAASHGGFRFRHSLRMLKVVIDTKFFLNLFFFLVNKSIKLKFGIKNEEMGDFF